MVRLIDVWWAGYASKAVFWDEFLQNLKPEYDFIIIPGVGTPRYKLEFKSEEAMLYFVLKEL